MEYREAVVCLDQLLDRDPAYRSLYAAALEFCADQMDEREAAEHIDSLRSNANQIQSGVSILATLVRRGGIERTVLVDGEPYDGTLEDLQNDESLDPNADIEFLVATTPAGIDVAEAYRQATSMNALFTDFPQFEEGFRLVLNECAGEGKTTQELQETLIAAGIVTAGALGAQQLHASYFTSKLEKYGALEWSRKRWLTTEKGKEAIVS